MNKSKLNKSRLIWISVAVLLVLFLSSVRAATFLKLSQKLQVQYKYFSKCSGAVFFPYVEYRKNNKTYRSSLFSNEREYDAAALVPRGVSEFIISLPTNSLGKYVRFSFTPVNRTDFDVLCFTNEVIRSNFYSDEFISIGLYHIDMEYVFDNGRPTCIQCILTQAFNPEHTPLVSIVDV